MNDEVKMQSVTFEEKKKEIMKKQGHMIMFIVLNVGHQ